MIENYPLAATQAARLLREAIIDCGLSQREIARRLGYKSSVVVSHMASGRAPIPIDRAGDIANEVGLDPAAFVIAVLKQRHPEIDFALLSADKRRMHDKPHADPLVAELELLAGSALSELPPGHIRVLKDVVSARDPSARWLNVNEVVAMGLIRDAFPGIADLGLTEAHREAVRAALKSASKEISHAGRPS